jgi:asparagine synthase (glutamine-hydrolysing)
MCGIFSLIYKNDELTESELKSLNISDAFDLSLQVANRGPDSTGIVSNNNGVFIFHRLSINDLSSVGNQPMMFDDILLLANAEIYNHGCLKKKYNLKCVSGSDCEVIIRLYQKIGITQTLNELHGVYAFILVDMRKDKEENTQKFHSKIYIARDRIGIRPLYYADTNDYTIFSSVPTTNFNYSHFPPGLCCKLQNGNFVNIHTHDFVRNMLMPFDIYETLRNTVMEAVRIRVPGKGSRNFGCMLSGGLDSSLIASILTRIISSQSYSQSSSQTSSQSSSQHSSQSSSQLRTYSVGMQGSVDLYYAKKVAEFLNTNHTELVFTAQEGFNVIPEVIKALATYDITTVRASVGMYLLSKYIATNTKDVVIFSGEGPDEILEGYPYFIKAPSAEEGKIESERLTRELHRYDVLRTDRCISSNGLEARVPFLDKKVVDLCLSMPAMLKSPLGNQKRIEKYVLRKAFESKDNNPFLPDEVLWRRKEGFSDGVSGLEKSWYQEIQERVEPLVGDYTGFPSKEAKYYKDLFSSFYPEYSLDIPYWMPKWTTTKDPSSRMLVTEEKLY